MNPLNPTVEIELGGETRNLKLDFGALAAAEGVTGRNYLAVRSLMRMSAGDLVAVIWGCLRHEDKDLTPEMVQGWIHYGNSSYVMGRLSEAINACFPAPKDEGDDEAGASPLEPTPNRRSRRSKPSAGSTSDSAKPSSPS